MDPPPGQPPRDQRGVTLPPERCAPSRVCPNTTKPVHPAQGDSQWRRGDPGKSHGPASRGTSPSWGRFPLPSGYPSSSRWPQWTPSDRLLTSLCRLEDEAGGGRGRETQLGALGRSWAVSRLPHPAAAAPQAPHTRGCPTVEQDSGHGEVCRNVTCPDEGGTELLRASPAVQRPGQMERWNPGN